jgi:AbrB family looped-hinge helix DNA binding protein
MIIEMRKKSQITLPKEIVKELNLLEGDTLDIVIENGKIILEPVAVYPLDYIKKLEKEIMVLKDNPNCHYKTFDNIDALVKDLKSKGK